MIKEKFKRAKGSVLFIDEAYSLVDGYDGFGDEAISTIVQEMENHRDDTVVIFAGYTKEMEKFLSKNPGLKSRIAYNIEFPDYTADELCQIADVIGDQNNVKLADGIKEKLRPVFESAVKIDGFGNGRYVRNIIEKAEDFFELPQFVQTAQKSTPNGKILNFKQQTDFVFQSESVLFLFEYGNCCRNLCIQL